MGGAEPMRAWSPPLLLFVLAMLAKHWLYTDRVLAVPQSICNQQIGRAADGMARMCTALFCCAPPRDAMTCSFALADDNAVLRLVSSSV